MKHVYPAGPYTDIDLDKDPTTDRYQIQKFVGAYTVCPRSSDPFYIVRYYLKWVTTSWTYSLLYKIF